MVQTLPLPILDLRLRDRRLEVDVPHRRRLGRVGEPTAKEAQERLLRDAPSAFADRRVVLRPIHRERGATKQVLEYLLVISGQALTQIDEVASGQRQRVLASRRLEGIRVERWIGGDARIATNAEVVLDATLRGEPVVVPADRVEDLPALHPLEPCDEIGVRVGHHVADVKRAADRGWRRIDRVDLPAVLRAVEPIRAAPIPPLRPLRLEAIQRWLLGNLQVRERLHSGSEIAHAAECIDPRRSV